MISEIRMRLLFNMLYFSDFVNTFIAYQYYNLSLFSGINQLFFFVIMTILKIICPALGGFIIDHVQYTLNIFFISLFLTIFSYIYFLGYCWKLIQDYLYFAIGFQILAQQLQTIIIQTMVSKHFPEDQIPRQLALFYQYGYAGRLLCAIITLIIYYRLEKLNTVSIITGEISTIVMSSIPLVILLSLTVCFQRSFKTFKIDAFQKIPELQLIPIQSKGNLLQALKEILNTDRAVIAIAAGSIMSIIQIWQSYDVTSLYHNFKNEIDQYFIDSKNGYIILGFIIQEAPIIISIIFARYIAKNIQQQDNALKYLTDKTADSLMYFLLSTLQFTCTNSLLGLRMFFFIITLIMQQFIFTVVQISSASLIGIQKQNFRTQGLSFGLIQMFINIFNIWVISVLSQLPNINSTVKLTIIYGFAFCYSVIGIVLSKMLQFVKQFNEVMKEGKQNYQRQLFLK
ncbi:unnamed protein product [Paramecium pentaurelia]|uniref:Uncharacterized protein n=1 Tax=Paramecium pentaurelia TaxID=43138 RepID=A0A8S1X7C6_9CILI|nr:unnamed protein product [Paramecium pentaurelia]